MGKTSAEIKNRYNKKTYSTYNAAVKKENFKKIEEIRAKTGLSRSQFLEMLVTEKYGNIFET